MTEIVDLRDTPGFNPNQHCTYPVQDGVNDYSFSHTAGYCGMPQPRRCECGYDYADLDFFETLDEALLRALQGASNVESTDEFKDAIESIKDVLEERESR